MVIETKVAEMTTWKCGVCGKPLTDPVSVHLGIGPVCRITLKFNEAKDMTRNLFSSTADYTYELHGNVVCIIDHDNGMSVTNDIERVLADIKGEGVPLGSYRVIYRDTMGVWDEVVLNDDGTFRAFKSINEQQFDAALAKVQTA